MLKHQTKDICVKRILAGHHLLIAEDNPTNQIVVAKMVEQLGGTFDIASDGVEAIQIFDPDTHDLALLDIEMPRKSGLEVIRFIRERQDVPENFPIVALTAFVLSDHRDKILNAGANSILAKPITDLRKFGEDIASQLRGQNGGGGVSLSGLVDLENSMGKEVMPELLASFRNDLEKLQTGLKTLFQDKEQASSQLKSIAHSFLPLAQMAGDEGALGRARQIEGEAAKYNEAKLQDARDFLVSRIEDILIALKDFSKIYDKE